VLNRVRATDNTQGHLAGVNLVGDPYSACQDPVEPRGRCDQKSVIDEHIPDRHRLPLEELAAVVGGGGCYQGCLMSTCALIASSEAVKFVRGGEEGNMQVFG